MATSIFGKDTSCTSALRPGQFVTGARLVGEALYRRLSTPRGMLRGGDDEESYGFDLLGVIGSTQSDADAIALQGKIRNEALKDERIIDAQVTVTLTRNGPAVSLDVLIEVTTGAGPFTLNIGVDEATVELLNLAA
jgi:hypothetical protein